MHSNTSQQEEFKSTARHDSNGNLHCSTSQQEEDESNSSDDDGLPPLEANMNRIRPLELQSDAVSDSDSDS